MIINVARRWAHIGAAVFPDPVLATPPATHLLLSIFHVSPV